MVLIIRVSKGLIVGGVSCEAADLVNCSLPDIGEDLLNHGHIFLCVLVGLASGALAVAPHAPISIARIAICAWMSAAPTEPAAMTSVKIHGDLGKGSKFLHSISDPLHVGLFGGGGTVGLSTHVSYDIWQRVGLYYRHDLQLRIILKQ